MKKSLSLILAILGATAPFMATAFADDAPSMDLPSVTDEANKSPWSGGAELTANLTTGNTDIKTFGASGEVSLRTLPLTTTLGLGFMQNLTDKVEKAREIKGHLRTGMNVVNNLDFFAQGTYYQNKFSGIDSAMMGEVGLGIYAVNSEVFGARVEGGLGYMGENYFPVIIHDNTNDANFIVGTVGVGLRLKLTDVADLTDDAMWIENLKTTADWRVTNTAAITSHLSKAFSIKIAYNIMFRKIPVPTFLDTDTSTTAALIVKF